MGFSVDGISQARILEWVAIPGDLPDPEIDPRSPALQADSLSSELPEKPPRMEIRKIKHIHYTHTHTHTHIYACTYVKSLN